MDGNSYDEIKFLHKVLLTDTQVSKVDKTFANSSSANIKFSNTHLSKTIQSGGFVTDIFSSVTFTLDNIFRFTFEMMNSY